jgi:hypothetical protein
MELMQVISNLVFCSLYDGLPASCLRHTVSSIYEVVNNIGYIGYIPVCNNNSVFIRIVCP